MQKPDSLRAYVTAALPDLARDPDRLQIFIDKGRIRSTGAKGLAFEYAYSLNLVLLDFAGDVDLVMLTILAWLRVHQAELLQNYQTNPNAIPFEADILDGDKIDLSLQLELTERVITTPREGGGYDMVHPPEPSADPAAQAWSNSPAVVADLVDIYFGGELVATLPPA